MTDDTAWIRERSHEAYATNYDIVFPLDEPLAGRNRRKDPFHQELVARGCVFQSRLGWERPGWFSSAEADTGVRDYDWKGYYGNTKHATHPYHDLINGERTFSWPGVGAPLLSMDVFRHRRQACCPLMAVCPMPLQSHEDVAKEAAAARNAATAWVSVWG